MERIAVVAPADRFRSALVAVADAGVVEPERLTATLGPAGEALRRRRSDAAAPRLAAMTPSVQESERELDPGILAGEAELEQVAAAAVRRGAVMAIAGWSPSVALAPLGERLNRTGAALVRLPPPRGAQPPTLPHTTGASGAFQPLLDIYTTIPYADLNPSLFAGLAYVAMFGMMFGDVGHGIVLVLFGLALWKRWPARLARLSPAAPFVIGSGVASVLFGFAFGEAFGPTHLVPTLWIAPLDHPTTLLAVAIAIGGVMLSLSHFLACANRWREGGALRAFVAISGFAGTSLYLGIAVVGFGWYAHVALAVVLGGAVAATGLLLGFVGLYQEAGGRALGAVQAGVELFDAVVRLGTNTVSFARLAAFGLTHAALGSIIWTNTVNLSHHGVAGAIGCGVLFLVGNAVAFALEALVCAIQAMRLEYYELFSRVFLAEGRPFVPWHVPSDTSKENPCSNG